MLLQRVEEVVALEHRSLDRALGEHRGREGVEVVPGAGIATADGRVDADVLEDREQPEQQPGMVGRGEGGVALVGVDGRGPELDIAGLVQHHGPQDAMVGRRCREAHRLAVGHRIGRPRPAGPIALVDRLQVHRSPGDPVGEQAEDAVGGVERGVVDRHGSSTSTMSDTARCTSTSSLTALEMATSHARRAGMPPTTSWAV